MKKTIFLIALVSLISGCAMFTEAADRIAGGVEKYCEQPYLYRSDFRNTINAQLTNTGHTVHVHCAGDPETETSNISSEGINGFFCKEASTKTQEDLLCLEHVMQLTQVWPLPLPPLLSQLPQVQSPLYQPPRPILIHLVPPLSRTLPQLKPS